MSDICQLEITSSDYRAIKNSEAVVVREYEGRNGYRFAEVVNYGSLEEMEDLADRHVIMVLPVGVSIIACRAVLVCDLIEPEVRDDRHN